MKKICFAALLLICGILPSCIQKDTRIGMAMLLKPNIGIRKDIGTAD